MELKFESVTQTDNETDHQPLLQKIYKYKSLENDGQLTETD